MLEIMLREVQCTINPCIYLQSTCTVPIYIDTNNYNATIVVVRKFNSTLRKEYLYYDALICVQPF